MDKEAILDVISNRDGLRAAFDAGAAAQQPRIAALLAALKEVGDLDCQGEAVSVRYDESNGAGAWDALFAQQPAA